jgi:ATP-binding cassette, subfamily B, bacterial
MDRKLSSLQVLMQVLGRNKWAYLASSVLFIGVMFMRSLEPKVFQWLTDSLLENSLYQGRGGGFLESLVNKIGSIEGTLVFFGLMYVAIALVRGTGAFLAHYINALSTENAMERLRNRLFAHLQSIPMYQYVIHSKGEIVQRSTNDLEVAKGFIQNNFVEVVRIFSMLFFSTAMVASISLWATFISLVLMPIVVVMSLAFYKRQRLVWERHERQSDALNNLIQENIQGIRTTKAFGMGHAAIESFEKRNRMKLETGISHFRLHSYYWPAMNLVVFLQIVVSNLACIYMASIGMLSIGEMLAVGLFVNMMLWPFRKLSEILSNFTMAMVALERIGELLALEPEDTGGGIQPESISGSIVFDKVGFKYPGQHSWAIYDISFSLAPGERLALVGPSGSGKTTVLLLLMGMYKPTEGNIYIDSKPVSSYSTHTLRTKIGMALQSSIMFSDSVLGNMLSVSPEASEQAVYSCMKAAQIDSIAGGSHAGLAKMIGEKGVNLSGGQKQRMAIARLLLKNPDVIVLDDSTSYIDEGNEAALLKELDKFASGKTCIFVSHKLSALRFCGKVAALDSGRLLQYGLHDMLLQQPGYCRTMYQLQTD